MNNKVDHVYHLAQEQAAHNMAQNDTLNQHSKLLAQTLETQKQILQAQAKHMIHHKNLNAAKPQVMAIPSMPSQMNHKHGHRHSLGYDHKHHPAHEADC